MEKLVFVFRRKPGATREAFFAHYLDNHSPLGLRVVENLSGYTVNHLITEAEFDAVTEIWTPSAADFAGGKPKDDEGARAIIADHQFFMGPQDTYVVEERVRRDGALTGPLASLSRGIKAVSFHRAGEPLPEPPVGAHRVVDNHVLRTIYLRDRPVASTPGLDSDLAVIRTVWADRIEDLGELPPESVLLREYRFRLVAEPA